MIVGMSNQTDSSFISLSSLPCSSGATILPSKISKSCSRFQFLITVFPQKALGNESVTGTFCAPSLPGPDCSTTLLVNETLKFQTIISQICQYFLLKKCEKLLQCKSFSHFFNKKYQRFSYKVVKHLTS